MPFPSNHKWSKYNALLAGVFIKNERNYLFIGIFYHRKARYRGICSRCPGVEKPQEIINFGNGSYSGARVLSGCLLFNGNDGAQACN